jgi:hypothetical protein
VRGKKPKPALRRPQIYGSREIAVVRRFLREQLAAATSHPRCRRQGTPNYPPPAGAFLSPANEWYLWNPSPRLNKNIKVLLTLSPSNCRLGFKDTLQGGDLPVVWTNMQYRMLYMNMGHGDRIFVSDTQNHLFEDALLWLGRSPVQPRR